MNEIVQTAAGAVRGAAVGVPGGETVLAFRGIPYAAPPVGELRWRAPRPAAAWTGVRDALEFGPDFPQAPNARMRAPSQSEDCLYINVWTPKGAAPGSLPVMVWFHGGGFAAGSGSDIRSDGTVMAAKGVVVVSFNYRSGLFGFLAHPELSRENERGVSGNYGLLDQLAALEWIRDNIAAFGGDSSNVTAFGVSAGSASISMLLASPIANGLFHQAILHSPGAGRPLASLADAERAGTALGTDLGALRALPAKELFGKTALLSPKVRGLTTPRVLRPIRDGWVLPEDERPAFKAGRLHAMPLIVGSNLDEGTLLTKAWGIETLAQYREQVDLNFGAAAAQAAELYPAHTDAEARPRVAEMFADTQFNYGTRLLAESMARVEPRTWRYLFTRRLRDQPDGPHHGEEVPYVFGNVDDRQVSDAMLAAWVAFAKHGDPNHAALPRWGAYHPDEENHLVFGDVIEEGHHWRSAQLDFLDRFFEPSTKDASV